MASRKYKIEWPDTDELRFVVKEWWTLSGEGSENWVERPYTQILVGTDEIVRWVLDSWEVEV